MNNWLLGTPRLGQQGKMAAASVQEQAGAGLAQLTPEEYERFDLLNQTYKQKLALHDCGQTSYQIQHSKGIRAAIEKYSECRNDTVPD